MFFRLFEKHLGLVVLAAAAICSLLFNFAVWVSAGTGGLLVGGLANAFGGILIGLLFRKEIKRKELDIRIALLGALGILGIVFGLRGSHGAMPTVSVSIEMVYAILAVVSLPLFTVFFGEKAAKIDVAARGLVLGIVIVRALFYGVSTIALLYALVAVLGYCAFGAAVKLAKNHRATNVAMTVIGGTIVVIVGTVQGNWSSFGFEALAASSLGGFAVLGVVVLLGKAFSLLKGMNNLVMPLMYNGVMALSPILEFFTRQHVVALDSVLVGMAIVLISLMEYRWHLKHSQ